MPEHQGSLRIGVATDLRRGAPRVDNGGDDAPSAVAMMPRIPSPGRRRADGAAHELAQELAYTRLLQSISSQLIADQPSEALYECVAAAAATLLQSDFASMQVLHPERDDALSLIAHRGFSDAAAAGWAWVARDAASSCGAALRAGRRVIVPDVEQCEFMIETGSVQAYLDAGIRAAQSTPLYARDGRLVGMLSTHWAHRHVPSERALSLFDILARQAADLIERRSSETELRDAHDVLEQKVAERTREVRELLGRLVNSQEEERRRIAREMHDAMGQQMTALRMNLELLAATPTRERALQTQQLAEELDRSIDFLAWELRPAALDGLGLSAALETLVVEWSARFDIAADYHESRADTFVDAGGLGRDVESNVYRVVQEALHNVHKHARATHVSVRVERRPDELLITVEDDGCGFMPEQRPGRATTQMGLIGMRERAALIGGEFRIDSTQGQGTAARLSVPLNGERERRRS